MLKGQMCCLEMRSANWVGVLTMSMFYGKNLTELRFTMSVWESLEAFWRPLGGVQGASGGILSAKAESLELLSAA